MKLCLNMIVRNEAAIIARALESVAEVVDYWVICDTGSTDGTEAIIADFFSKRGIPGDLHRFDFENFGSARNRALEAARQSAGTFDYVLLMDADMQLRVDDPTFRSWLTAPGYMVLQKSGTLAYWNMRLVRRDTPASYVGVTHEYLSVPAGHERLEAVWFLDSADGGNRPGKFERDAALLLKGLEDEPDNARYVYYLAQSYRDAGRLEEAAETYHRRHDMGGWEEEAWHALLQEARCRRTLGDVAAFQRLAAQAFEERSHRAEPLYDLAVHFRQLGQYEVAMGFLELATHVPWPAQDRLFIEDFVYRDGIRQEIAICGFYCAGQARKQAGRFACNSLAIDRGAASEVRAKARENLIYYARRAVELFPSYVPKRLEVVAPPGMHATTPSIMTTRQGYLAVVRLVNYETTDALTFRLLSGDTCATRNQLIELDADLEPFDSREILAPIDWPAPEFLAVRGMEDLRVFDWNDAVWVVATQRERTALGWCETVLARLDRTGVGDVRMTDWRLLSPLPPTRHEKNWMPVIEASGLSFVYTCDPPLVVDERGERTTRGSCPAALDHLRGGSQLIPFDAGWLALVHEVVILPSGRNYMHRFVWFDDHVVPRRITEPFKLGPAALEFCAGLAWHRDGDRLVASFGVGDCEAWLATFAAEEVRVALRSQADAAIVQA